jgi:hypothetical protein
VAVNVTVLGRDPQDEKNDGVVVRLTLEVLALALRTKPDVVGLHVNEFELLPVPEVAGKLMVTGLVAQVALGVLEAENPTAA